MDVSPEEGAKRTIVSWQARGWMRCTHVIGHSRKQVVENAVANLIRTLRSEVERRMTTRSPGLALDHSAYVRLAMMRLQTVVVTSASNPTAILTTAGKLVSDLDARIKSALWSSP